MRSFSFSDGKSDKFWEITLQGAKFTVRFGKTGTGGQTQVKEFASAAAAQKEHDKLVAEKVKKGYVETTVATKAPPASAAPPVVAKVPPPPAPVAATPSGKRTFEFSDASSHKFWAIERNGTELTINYGRIGSAGQTQLKALADEAKAQKEYDKLVAEKTGKGYRETTPAAKPAATTLRESLEEAILEDFDDLVSHMAYADYLAEQGDPRGDFIRVQLALEDASKSQAERDKLKKQEEALLKEHRAAWLGELEPFVAAGEKLKPDYGTPEVKCTFVRGWLHALEVSRHTVALTRILARAPETRSVQRLVLADNQYEEAGEYEAGDDIPEDADDFPQLFPLVRSPYLGNVKTFVLGEMMSPAEEAEADDGGFSCHTQGDGVLGLIKLMPKLEELYLLAHNVDAGQLFSLRSLTHLRVLMLYHGREYPLARLAKNPSLGNLTHLLCHPHAIEDEESYIRLADLRAITRSAELKSLTHLRLRLSDMGNKGAKEIVDSGILQRLKVLDLRHGCISDEGARTLAASPHLKNLELLDLTNNCMTDDGVNALKATGVKLTTGYQWHPSDDEFNNREYLYAGDIE